MRSTPSSRSRAAGGRRARISETGLLIRPVTPGCWGDLERLFGPRGACGGCWCMHWRLKRSEYERAKGEGNRRALRAIVDSEAVPGLLACAGGTPIGWCAVAPRESYPTLERSRVLARVDDARVWSIVCLFTFTGVASAFRGAGFREVARRSETRPIMRRSLA